MSVEFEEGNAAQELERSVKRREVILQLARRSHIPEPETVIDDVEALIDSAESQYEVALERGWTRERMQLVSGLTRLYMFSPDLQPETGISPVEDAETVSVVELDQKPALQKSLQNVFGPILDETELQTVAGFRGARAELLAHEMGLIYAEKSQKPEFAGRYAARIKLLLEGVSVRQIADSEAITPSAVSIAFTDKFPKLYAANQERLVARIGEISALETDEEIEAELQHQKVDNPLPRDVIRRPIAAARQSTPPPVRSPTPRQPRAAREPAVRKPVELPPRVAVKRAEPKDTSNDLDATFGTLDSVGEYMRLASKVALLNAEQEVELAKNIEAGMYAAQKLAWLQGDDNPDFIGKRRHALSPEERRDLMQVIRTGERSKNHMLEANLRLVISIAKRYTGRGLELLDLIQEGNLGLIRGMEKFDYTKGFKFSTYATWWIRQSVTRGLADSARTIRIPVHMVEEINKVNRVKREMFSNLDREPTIDELAEEMGIKPEKIEEILSFKDPISLDMPVGGDEEAPLGDFIGDEGAFSTEEAYEKKDQLGSISEVLDTLPPREADVIRRRMGLHDGRVWTLDQIGVIHNVTRERIRQIERDGMNRLRTGERRSKLSSLLDGEEL